MLKLLAALPLDRLGRRPDVVLALAVCAVVAMLVLPVPGLLLDALIAVNIAASLIVLLVAIFAANALELSTFPSLLLFTTLFRLALNVSATRGILSEADAGEVVKSFGEFVLGGDVIVGMVLFLVVTLVQFLVIAKGAERVAEVAARFTLDAMPGKQMSIDAAIRSGAVTEEEGEAKRDELGRLSQLFGNMDGAMKFVKGDAIAGLVITALNMVAGVTIGAVRDGLSLAHALETYSVLTVGDGLVAQISALLIALASGVLVTRVEARDKTKNLGFSLKEEVLSRPQPLFVGAAIMLLLGLVPGLPLLPFAFCSVVVASIAAFRHVFTAFPRGSDATRARQLAFKQKLEKKVEEAKAQKSMADKLAPSVVPLGIDIDPVLSTALGFLEEGNDDNTELLEKHIPQLREALYLETGVRFPGVRVRPHVSNLASGEIVIRVNDVPVLSEKIDPRLWLATTNPDNLRRLTVEAKPIQHPISKAKMSLIREDEKDVVQAAGIPVWNASGIIALYVASVMRKHARSFIGLQEVGDLVMRLEKAFPSLVKEVIPKVTTLSQLVAVLRRLVDEGVSIRDMKTIVEALGEHGMRDGDDLYLSEKVRAALAVQLAYAHAGLEQRLSVVLLDPIIEDTILGGIQHSGGGRMLTLEPQICREVIKSIAGALQPMVARGKRPVLLTQPEVRRFVRKLIETDLPQTAVLSFDELPADLTIQPVATASLVEARN